MSVRVIRDWRGIKYKTTGCSTNDLLVLRTNALRTEDRVRRFVAEIDAELAVRQQAVTASLSA